MIIKFIPHLKKKKNMFFLKKKKKNMPPVKNGVFLSVCLSFFLFFPLLASKAGRCVGHRWEDDEALYHADGFIDLAPWAQSERGSFKKAALSNQNETP